MKNLELYRELEILTGSGLWKIDFPTNQLIWSKGMYDIYEIDYNIKNVDLTDLINTLVHPDDREKINQKITQSISTGEDYHIVHRILFPNGTIKYIKGNARCIKNEKGCVIKMTGVAIDITLEKKIENQLKQKNKEQEVEILTLKQEVQKKSLLDTMELLENRICKNNNF